MNCYQKYLTSKPLSNYYVFFKIFKFEIFGFNYIVLKNKLKSVTIIFFKNKYLEKYKLVEKMLRYQIFLVAVHLYPGSFWSLKVPLFQVIFMNIPVKNPLLVGLSYNLKGFELFSKTNCESS